MCWLRWPYFQRSYHICCILTRSSCLVYLFDFCAGLGEHEDKFKYVLLNLQIWCVHIVCVRLGEQCLQSHVRVYVHNVYDVYYVLIPKTYWYMLNIGLCKNCLCWLRRTLFLKSNSHSLKCVYSGKSFGIFIWQRWPM